MVGFPSPFSGESASFDDYEEFVPDHLPDPGPFLAGHDVLTGAAHVAVHELAADLFEERSVYDLTFDYNLARLNLDERHPDAGYRYAEESDGDGVLRAEFTPTTPFCPQSRALTVASFRAWNGLSDRHQYDLVRVRVHPSHHRSDGINDALADLEARYLETGSVTAGASSPVEDRSAGGVPDAPF